MRIGIVIGRMGGIDGVALETEKWIAVLSRLGHQVRVLTGEIEGMVPDATLLPELAFGHPLTAAGQRRAFFSQDTDEAGLLADLEREAACIEDHILRWIQTEGIDCLLAENASALPCHLTMGLALRRIYERTGLPVVTHDHDFWWERGDRYATPYEGIRRIIAGCFPVKLPNVRHAVLNRAAQETLARRFGIEGAVVVPNVMDFDNPPSVQDTYNADLRQALGLDDEALLLFQVTRIVRRKGIEIAVDLVHRLADPRVQLVITGTATDDADGYREELAQQVHGLGLQRQVHFAARHFDKERRTGPGGSKVYALFDAYAHADACTYFSLYEGFGNAFVEAVAARVPVLVNSYEPVYWPEIGSLGFETVMIEKGQLSGEAVEETRRLLDDARLRERMAEQNFALGKKHFSYQALQRILETLFAG